MVRFKNRYLLFEVGRGLAALLDAPAPAPAANASALFKAVRDAVQTACGDYAVAAIQHSFQGSSYWGRSTVKYYSPTTGIAILRVAREHYRLVWLALTLITEFPANEPCMISVLHVGGTIRSCQRVALRRSVAHFDTLRLNGVGTHNEAALYKLRETVERELNALAV